VVDWARQAFNDWREQRVQVIYEIDDFEQVGEAILARARSRARVLGMDLDNRWTYRFVVRDDKIVSLSMHDSYEEAATAVPPPG
jgi:hypothetical protein